jgi:hypothetical protein
MVQRPAEIGSDFCCWSGRGSFRTGLTHRQKTGYAAFGQTLVAADASTAIRVRPNGSVGEKLPPGSLRQATVTLSFFPLLRLSLVINR